VDCPRELGYHESGQDLKKTPTSCEISGNFGKGPNYVDRGASGGSGRGSSDSFGTYSRCRMIRPSYITGDDYSRDIRRCQCCDSPDSGGVRDCLIETHVLGYERSEAVVCRQCRAKFKNYKD